MRLGASILVAAIAAVAVADGGMIAKDPKKHVDAHGKDKSWWDMIRGKGGEEAHEQHFHSPHEHYSPGHKHGPGKHGHVHHAREADPEANAALPENLAHEIIEAANSKKHRHKAHHPGKHHHKSKGKKHHKHPGKHHHHKGKKFNWKNGHVPILPRNAEADAGKVDTFNGIPMAAMHHHKHGGKTGHHGEQTHKGESHPQGHKGQASAGAHHGHGSHVGELPYNEGGFLHEHSGHHNPAGLHSPHKAPGIPLPKLGARDVGDLDAEDELFDSPDFDDEFEDDEDADFDDEPEFEDEEEDEDPEVMKREVEHAEEEADPNEMSEDESDYDTGNDGDDDILDGEIGDPEEVDDDEDLGEDDLGSDDSEDEDAEDEGAEDGAEEDEDEDEPSLMARDPKKKPKHHSKHKPKKGWGFFPW